MKYTHWLVSLTMAAALFAGGCGGAAPEPDAPAPTTAPSAPNSANKLQSSASTKLQFEVIKESMLPQELSRWTDLSELPKSTPSARVGDYLYVAVVGGVESVGASAIVVEQVELLANPPTITVKALVTPGKGTGDGGSTFPRSFIRIPYAASQPVPVVWTQIQVEAAANPGAVVSTPPNAAGGDKPATAPATSPTSPSAPAPANPPPGQSNPEPNQQMTMLKASALPASLSAWAKSTVQVPGGVAQFVDGALYVMVSAGQRNTGGYSVVIESVQVREQTVYVSARLNSPAPGAMVTQAITYPKAFAKVNMTGTGQPQVIVDWK